jgi:3-phosphoglycerate kinase
VFEFPKFAKGTVGIANTLAALTPQGCITIIGGGDSVAAVEQAGVAGAMSHISTGGTRPRTVKHMGHGNDGLLLAAERPLAH